MTFCHTIAPHASCEQGGAAERASALQSASAKHSRVQRRGLPHTHGNDAQISIIQVSAPLFASCGQITKPRNQAVIASS